MKTLQFGLWAIGAAMCLFVDFGRGDQRNLITEAAYNSAPAQELARVTAETSQPDKLDVLHPAAQDSSHAIVPDTRRPRHRVRTCLRLKPQRGVLTPPVKESSPSTTSLPPGHPNDSQTPAMPKEEVVTITSAATIRNGPSSSADIIGRAHAGAKARVASTEAGWTQIVDPASGP
jgi:hypothetical protein